MPNLSNAYFETEKIVRFIPNSNITFK